uniref:Uncharacterized protein n=1 Tax=Arundo donax TaxID=35708 RepID=A0A0A9FPM4_ARUDO
MPGTKPHGGSSATSLYSHEDDPSCEFVCARSSMCASMRRAMPLGRARETDG